MSDQEGDIRDPEQQIRRLAERLDRGGYGLVADLLREGMRTVGLPAATGRDAGQLGREAAEIAKGLDILSDALRRTGRPPVRSDLPILADSMEGDAGTRPRDRGGRDEAEAAELEGDSGTRPRDRGGRE